MSKFVYLRRLHLIMKLRSSVILAIFFLSGVTAYSQEKVDDDYLICYANNKRPMFDGDMSLKKLNIWVENHLQYPKTLKKAGIQGRVILGFTITKDGELTDVKVRKGVHPLFDAEAIRVIKTTAGHWTGGFDAFTGKPVDVSYTYPVIFRLNF